MKTCCCIVAKTSYHVILAKLREQGFSAENLPNARLNILEDDLQIAFLELLAFMLTIFEILELIKQFAAIAKLVKNKIWIFKSDNSNVCSYVTKGRCPYFPFNRCLEYLLQFELINNCKIIMD